MCGIAGLVGPVNGDATVLDKLLSALVHRGPDDEGRFADERAALGQRAARGPSALNRGLGVIATTLRARVRRC